MKTPALVLSTVNYGDRQLIVDLLTRQAGRQSFIVRLSQSPHGRVHRRLFQPLTLLDADFTLRPNRTLQRFSEVRMSRPWTSLTANPYKMPLVFFVAEFLPPATSRTWPRCSTMLWTVWNGSTWPRRAMPTSIWFS